MIEKYPKKQRFILPIIHDIQRQYKYIPRQSLENLSEYMDIPFSRLYSMVILLKRGLYEQKLYIIQFERNIDYEGFNH